ncbi:MAG: tetratricopeptide repeat protein [Candidatus Cryptobacteroides sp.]|jgi:Tetratricopeptide repeat.
MRLFRYLIVFQLLMLVSLNVDAQIDRKDVRTGNRKFKKGNWAEADISYRKALVKDSVSIAANYNLANNLYRQGNMEEAGSYMDKIKEIAPLSAYSADYYYNTGNIAIARKDWQGAVDAFKQALLKNPDDLDAKENYIYAKKMLDEQKKNQDKEDENKDQKKNEQNQDNQNDNKDQNDNKQDKDKQSDRDKGQNNQSGQQEQKISSQQAQQMLKAIQAKEKETQDKVNKEKAAVLKSRQKEKNW